MPRVDQVIAEHGTLPMAETYFALKEQASNRGEIDLDSFIANQPQTLVRNPQGKFQLFRVGDAVASRNIHAALYESLRLIESEGLAARWRRHERNHHALKAGLAADHWSDTLRFSRYTTRVTQGSYAEIRADMTID